MVYSTLMCIMTDKNITPEVKETVKYRDFQKRLNVTHAAPQR